MNRREFDREPTNLELYAQVGGHPPQRLKASNISTQGIFVEDWSSPPRSGSEVDLVFLIGGGAVVRLLRRVARVARVVDGGVGLVHGTEAVAGEDLQCAVARQPRYSPWSLLQWPDVE
jgi:hypothetical protein